MNQDKLVTPSAPISMTEIIVLFKSGLQNVEALHSWFHSLKTNHTKGSLLRRLWHEQEPWIKSNSANHVSTVGKVFCSPTQLPPVCIMGSREESSPLRPASSVGLWIGEVRVAVLRPMFWDNFLYSSM